MKKVAFFTLGCKVNAYDSEYMQEQFVNNGFEVVSFGEDADIVIINTCTVTAVADKKSRAAIRRASRCGKVIVAGCLAQKDAQSLLEMEEVDAVSGTDNRSSIVSIAERLLIGERKIDATQNLEGCSFEELKVAASGNKTRAVLKIQEGCDNFCSYCIIPYVRGRSRSRNLDEIINEAVSFAVNGAKEIVLTGIHIASYSYDRKGLADVINALGNLQNARIRLGSLEPGFLGEDFIKRIVKAKNLCPHFHVSLQSGSKSVLERMNRKYTPDEYSEFISMLRNHFDNPGITTDIIAGFPGETQEEHEETMSFVEGIGFSRVHVFPYSPREGTKAYDLRPRVPKAEAKKRALELIALGEVSEKKFIERLIGKRAEALFEEESKTFPGLFEGYSERYVRVAAKANNNELKAVTIDGSYGTIATGK